MLATEAGWATTDVQEVGSQPDFRVTFARMAARLLREMSRKHRIKDRVDHSNTWIHPARTRSGAHTSPLRTAYTAACTRLCTPSFS